MQAIKTAYTLANSNDIILLAGKGHEKYQQLKNKKIEFDDFKELKLLFKENKMLYNLFEYLELNYNLPGTGIFKYISFRSAMSIITSLIVSWIFGGKIINLIQKNRLVSR